MNDNSTQTLIQDRLNALDSIGTRPKKMHKPLILGSTSPFRKELLQRLNVAFATDKPAIDETQQTAETPKEYVTRLSLQKAQAVAARHPDSLIISSDQCSILDGRIRGKPGSHDNAVLQLQESSGQQVSFLTGLCLYDSSDDTYQLDVISFHVYFRVLSDIEIQRYLDADQPYQCAGSFKSEGLGISLFNKMQGDDPTALVGLPLIRLSEMLRQKGFHLP